MPQNMLQHSVGQHWYLAAAGAWLQSNGVGGLFFLKPASPSRLNFRYQPHPLAPRDILACLKAPGATVTDLKACILLAALFPDTTTTENRNASAGMD
eukprot:9554-Heterococcus_DN1.PRE.4